MRLLSSIYVRAIESVSLVKSHDLLTALAILQRRCIVEASVKIQDPYIRSKTEGIGATQAVRVSESRKRRCVLGAMSRC